MKEQYERWRKQLHDLSLTLKVDSVSDLQDLLCCMVLSECVYKLSPCSHGYTSYMHIAMFPWFAMGHLTPFLHLSNKLAKRRHKISFFIPTRRQAKLELFNLYPHLIAFFPVNVPHVEGLPHGAETTSDVPFSLVLLIMTLRGTLSFY
ncbi:cyanidin 3-O-galactoside 2''-O-xylosyltransferase FGGT1-like [Lotus japonicus]|uniref:cyanidin 3-O-galactoside 2''-O-xylosyltransferase FGGT1-like n=1 Tax=Lotus japonicus TaxID=34305 RepID=UPI00258CE141|nr:cyanidin 3-O-galactoside 2''-O-xylosyltransferase FGGT1-like [Lotus japonicus]